MSMNKFMHPRNIYRQKPDFKALVKQCPELTAVTTVDLNGRLKLDYKDKKALQLLTTCLLKRDFGLQIDLPPDKLVPTLPLRLNYILWLEDLEDALGWKSRPEVRGLDIGCGASCIYPLLGVVHSKHRWRMVGLELLEDSVMAARKNVEGNSLQEYIDVVQQESEDGSILKDFMGEKERFDFCMCNPPFFDDHDGAVHENRTSQRKEPPNASTGSDKELRIEGGELRFLERIIDESLELKERITVYTSMIGHKKNFEEILRIMKRRSISNVTTTRFCQGNTTRWGIAWSFSSAALLANVPDRFEQESSNRKSVGKPLEGKILSLEDVENFDSAQTNLLSVLKSLDLQINPLKGETEHMWELVAQDNTWSHQRRKRREAKRKLSPGSENRNNQERELDGASNSDGTPSKKLKSEQSCCEPVLKAVLCLKSKEGGYYLGLSYLSGIAGKDALNQILQFVKNNICS
ncbi:methyltransferase-like protein 16 homolog [Aedes aegypti]|uniref:U6 small nuclear RNA (adenine-(43)-N(6))-methyltransferase n=1 Tax=Aedes aegypti TaxID=7159 RepID=A0A1S4FM63_AEDAE|nr:methyltransferase-like protein 16 homolog [Aedes aegypti]